MRSTCDYHVNSRLTIVHFDACTNMAKTIVLKRYDVLTNKGEQTFLYVHDMFKEILVIIGDYDGS